jgi:hypothetical protein
MKLPILAATHMRLQLNSPVTLCGSSNLPIERTTRLFTFVTCVECLSKLSSLSANEPAIANRGGMSETEPVVI